MRRVTLKDVADNLGLSVAAVSLSLRGKGNLSPETREKIRAVSQKMGYIPNPLLSSLARRKFSATSAREDRIPIALLVPQPVSGSQSEDQRIYLDKAKERADSIGYQIHLYDYDKAGKQKGFSRQLYARGVQGIIISPKANELSLPELEWEKFSVVMVGNVRVPYPFHHISADYFESLERLQTIAHSYGYKRIGWALMLHQPMITDDHLRLAALRYLNDKAPTEQRVPLHIQEGFDLKESIMEWFREYKPDIVVGFHAGIEWLLRNRGVKIPKESAFACMLHRYNEDEGRQGIIAGMDYLEDRLLEAALFQLDHQIRNRMLGIDQETKLTLIRTIWHNGVSMPNKAAKIGNKMPASNGRGQW